MAHLFELWLKNFLLKISLFISQYCNGNSLAKRNVISQDMMYCNFITDGGADSQQIHNTCIVIPKNHSTSTVISLHNTLTVILH